MTKFLEEFPVKAKRVLSGVQPYARGFSLAAGWLSAIILSFFLLLDWSKALRFPAPHQYGEGVLVWMTSEIDKGKWPYGDILAVPSRYSCYAPLAPSISATVSRVIPAGEPGERYVWAGRLTTYVAWCAAAILLAVVAAHTMLSRFAVALMFLSAISVHSFFWSFRVDAAVIACQALVLYVLVKAPARWMKIALPLSVTLLTLTKPPAAVDLLPIGILSIALRGIPPLEFLKMTWKPAVYAVVIAPLTFFALDAMSGMRMSNNILWEQLGSGSTDPDGFTRNLYAALLPPEMWPALAWSAFAIAASVPSGRLKLAAIAISLLLCAAFSTKNGADTNYYFPLIMVLCATAGSYLRLVPGHAPFVLVATAILVLPLDNQPLHRKTDRQKADIEYKTDALKTIHDRDNFLSEDPFFSVLAGREPLVTDMFQLTLAAANADKSAAYLSNIASGAWGGFRLKGLMARSEDFSLEETAIPMPLSYAHDAVWVKEISKFPPTFPPLSPDWKNVRQEFLKRGFFSFLFLILLALVPTRCLSSDWSNRRLH